MPEAVARAKEVVRSSGAAAAAAQAASPAKERDRVQVLTSAQHNLIFSFYIVEIYRISENNLDWEEVWTGYLADHKFCLFFKKFLGI